MVFDGSRLTLIEGSGEWSALYLDGKLDRVGDHYLAQERILELCGVVCEQSDDFLRGQDGRAGVAQTLNELSDYRLQREEKEAEILKLRKEASELLARAKEIEGSK